MENYGSSSRPPYPYNNQYPYPYHPPYPPPSPDPYHPPYPPPSPDPYHQPYPYPYAYPAYPYQPPPPLSSPPQSQPVVHSDHKPQLSHSGSFDYHAHYQQSQGRPTSYSGPIEYSHSHSASAPYPYPYPSSDPIHSQGSASPSLQHQTSSSYGTLLPPYPQQPYGQYPPHDSSSQAPSRISSSSNSNHDRQDSYSAAGVGAVDLNDTAGPRSSVYPPLDDLFSKVHLNDNSSNSSAPASPPAPAGQAAHSSVMSHHHTSSLGSDRRGEFYGYPNSTFPNSPGNWDGAYLGRTSSSGLYSALPHSSSFSGSQHGQNMQIVPLQINKGSLKVLLLHGNLDIWVFDAKNLPNMDMFHKTLGDMLNKLPGNISNRIEGQMKGKITSDPYVSISITGAVIGRTYVISNSENPVWTQHFYVPVAHNAAELHFTVKDSDVVGSQLIGIVPIPVEQIYSGARIEGSYPILNSNGKPCKPGASLTLSVQYTPIDQLSIYHQGVGAGPEYHGVPGTYFPLRKGGNVTLYQDAHVPDGSLPHFQLDHGMSYVHGKCWHDIFDAIRHATRLIYITGWSVWHKVRLVRDAGSPSGFTLGDILKSKSQEGVRVLLLIWDDPTSRSILGYKTDGIMATHDEETRRFFKHSSVQVLLCPRMAGKKHSWVRQRVSASTNRKITFGYAKKCTLTIDHSLDYSRAG